MRRQVIFIIFLLIILLYASPSFAQPNFNLIPSLTISETYDSNIYSAATDVEDYVTRLGVNLSPVYNGPNIELKGNYLLWLNIFARRPEENVVTQDGSIDIDLNRWFQKLFKSGVVTVTEDFTFTPDLKDYYFVEERGEIGPLSSYGVRTRRTDAFRNAAGVNVAFPVTRRVNISTSYSNLLTEYKNPEFRDNMTNTVGLGLGYAFLPGDSIYGNVSVSNIKEDAEDSNSYSLLIGIRHSASPFTTFDINAGVVTLDPETGDSDSTFRGGASLTKRARAHTYNAGYSRTLNTVTGISGRPTIAEIFYVNITNIHSERLTSNIGANYAINRSINKAIGGNDVDTHSYNLSGGMNYTVRKWLRCSLTMSHFNQESDMPSAVDLQRNLITLALVGIWN